jgi:hypothetical protein
MTLPPPATLTIKELSRIFWNQRLLKFEKERNAWNGSEGQRRAAGTGGDRAGHMAGQGALVWGALFRRSRLRRSRVRWMDKRQAAGR